MISSDKLLMWIQEQKALLFILLPLSLFHLPFFFQKIFLTLEQCKSQHFSPRNFLPKTTLPCSISPSTLIKCHTLSTAGSLSPVTLVASKSLLGGTKGSFPLTQSLLLFKRSRSTEEKYKPVSLSIYIYMCESITFVCGFKKNLLSILSYSESQNLY